MLWQRCIVALKNELSFLLTYLPSYVFLFAALAAVLDVKKVKDIAIPSIFLLFCFLLIARDNLYVG